MLDLILEFSFSHKILTILILAVAYITLLSLLFTFVKRYYKNKKSLSVENQGSNCKTRKLNSYDICHSEKMLDNIKSVSTMLSRENHRVFNRNIFKTIKEGHKNNDCLSQISDCD